MNCRQVERVVFHDLNVKKLLSPGFVEARLHTDMDESDPNFRFNARIQQLRAKMLGKGNLGLPQYFVVDPLYPDQPIVYRGGAAGADYFTRFFEFAKKQAE